MRIVELLKRRSCGISIQGWGITQHVHMRSCGWMMWRRIVRRIRADRRSRDQWFAGTRWFQTTGPGAATTCRPYIHPQILAQLFSIIVIDTEMYYYIRGALRSSKENGIHPTRTRLPSEFFNTSEVSKRVSNIANCRLIFDLC